MAAVLGAARVEAGGIVEDVDVASYGVIPVRFSRCEAGWQAAFELRHADAGNGDVPDLAVVHRLVGRTRQEARSAIPHAVGFLLGTAVDAML